MSLPLKVIISVLLDMTADTTAPSALAACKRATRSSGTQLEHIAFLQAVVPLEHVALLQAVFRCLGLFVCYQLGVLLSQYVSAVMSRGTVYTPSGTPQPSEMIAAANPCHWCPYVHANETTTYMHTWINAC